MLFSYICLSVFPGYIKRPPNIFLSNIPSEKGKNSLTKDLSYGKNVGN